MSRTAISGELKKAGFGGLDDPNIVQQLAFCVRDHEHLRSLLSAMAPEKRNLAYQQLRPHLRFQAKPLDVYISEMREDAERRKLPIIDERGELVEFDDYHDKKAPLEVLAQEAIRQNEKEKNPKGTLELVCNRCTKVELIPAKNKAEAYQGSRLLGWKYIMVSGRSSEFHKSPQMREVAICPECVEARKPVIHNN